MLYLSMIILLFSIIMSKFIYNDLLSPAFLVGLPWLVSMFLLIFSEFQFDANSFYFLYFVIGVLIFQTGHLIFFTKMDRKITFDEKKHVRVIVNNRLIRSVVIFEFLVIIAYIFILLSYLRSSFTGNVFFTLKTANENIPMTSFMNYLNVFITAFSAFIVYVFFKSENIKNKNTVLIFQLLIGFLSSLLSLGRTAILIFVITIITEIIIYKNISNKKILKFGISFFTIGIVLFSIYNVIKYPYLLDSENKLELMLEVLSVYTSGSLVAFQNWISYNNELLFGQNTFRLLTAVFSSIGYNVHVEEILEEFTAISRNYTSNVYTVYHYYVADFGVLYSLVIQFIYGMIHGFLYKKLNLFQPFWIFIFSLSLYPLVMQFFNDQYISISSLWIQFLVYGVILFKSKIFIKGDKFVNAN